MPSEGFIVQRFACNNPDCGNVDKGLHRTQSAAHACGVSVRAQTPVRRQPALVGELASHHGSAAAIWHHLRGDGRLVSVEDLRDVPAFRDAPDDVLERVADFMVFRPDDDLLDDPETALDFITAAYTGYDDLGEWARDDLDSSGDADVTPTMHVEMALIDDIWLLPSRHGDGVHWVMRRD